MIDISEERKKFEEEIRRLKNPDEETKKRLEKVKKALNTPEGIESVANAMHESFVKSLSMPKEKREEIEQKVNLHRAFWDEYLAQSQCAALGILEKPKSWFDRKEL